MKLLSGVILYCAFLVIGNDCAKILGLFPFPGKSHWIMFRRVLKELAIRGHEVDVISHFPINEKLPGYNDISIRGSTRIFTNNFKLDMLQDLSYNAILDIFFHLSGNEVCTSSFSTPELQQLKHTTKKYDLVISELFGTDCMLGWAWFFGVPSIVMTSSENFPWAADRFGLPDNPSYIPTLFVDYNAKMTLYERIVNTWTLLKGKLYYQLYSLKPSTLIAREFFGPDLPDLDVLAYNTSLHLINTHFSISNSRPLVPNVVEVAGVHIETPKPVEKEFSRALETTTNGVIYLSMGSLVLTETFPPNILQSMFDALSEIPYKVLWKANREKFPKGLNIPTNIHFEPWMPQLDILCDPRVKLFVSHGGMMGTQESIHCGVPILGMPIFADQTLNMKRAITTGYGLMVDLKTLTKQSFSTALKAILFDPKYAEKAKIISALFKDRPQTPLEASIYWIEYILRHKGAPQMHSAAKYLSWYQYYLLDIFFVTIVIALLLVYLVYFLTSAILQKTNSKTKIKLN